MESNIFSFPAAGNSFEYQEGNYILISAPHAYDHNRDGVEKQGELGSDKIAKLTAMRLSLGYIVTQGAQLGDPNWDNVHPYRDKVLQVADGYKYLVDIHFMLPSKVDLNIGRGNDFESNSLLSESIFKVFEREGYRVAVNWPFAAKGPTLTSLAQSVGLPALQLEINYESFLFGDNGLEIFVDLLTKALSDFTG